MPIYTNMLSSSNMENITIESDLTVEGNILTTGNMTCGQLTYATFRCMSNVPFASQEIYPRSNTFGYDPEYSDMSSLSGLNAIVGSNEIKNEETGGFTMPLSGLYSIQLQACFSNASPDAFNGVYMYVQKGGFSNVRLAPNIAASPLLSTNYVGHLSGGDVILPTFYSTDADATLMGDAGETLISLSIARITQPPVL